MQAAKNPFNDMYEMKIMTATPEELILMLYDGGIKFCNQAAAKLRENNLSEAHRLIIRVEDIVRELQLSLDKSYAISRNFNSLYDYMYRRLVEANMGHNIEILQEVLGMFREFRDTWKEAMKLARQQQASRQPT
jgi:flagellar protein FliS